MCIMEVRSEILQRQNNTTELNTMLYMYFRGNLTIYFISDSKGAIKISDLLKITKLVVSGSGKTEYLLLIRILSIKTVR